MNTPSLLPPVESPEVADTSPPPRAAQLTSARLLAGNTLWSLVGVCSPALVAVFCLPVLTRLLGTDRLGMLTLAWVVVGYFGLFDFGLGRALTKLVAEKLGQGEAAKIPPLVWTSVVLMGGIGLIGTVVMFALSPWIVHSIVKVPAGLRDESLTAFYWLSISIPIVVITAGLRGVLEALQKFRLATAIRVPLGIFTYVGPVLILPFSRSLVPIVAVLVAARAAALIAHFWACFRVLPELRRSWQFDRASAGPLFRFGTWMTVSNIVGPMMVTFDRFVIGALVSVTAVAYYAVPSEVVSKLMLFPAALTAVLFPAFSTAHAGQRERVSFLFESSVKLICVAMFPIILAVVVFAPEGLRLWLGNDFAQNSAWVVRCLAVAIFVNSVGQVPFAHLQAAGRPDITAKLHLFELPLYIAGLLVLVRMAGIRGAALAWLLRTTVDSVLMFAFSQRVAPENSAVVAKLGLLAGGGVLFLALGAVEMALTLKVLAMVVMTAGSALLLWRWALSPREKTLLSSLMRGTNAAG
ncbi:MAG: flippase [Acidobacteriia bacterium]|nr:flippase [Terriglobia bacterium]